MLLSALDLIVRVLFKQKGGKKLRLFIGQISWCSILPLLIITLIAMETGPKQTEIIHKYPTAKVHSREWALR